MISFIIVTYNSEDFIIPNLKSINYNVQKNGYEIIIVDNASTDTTVALINGYTKDKQNHNIKLISNKRNKGFGYANNIGAKYAKGEILFFLNPDCEIQSKIEQSYFSILNDDIGIIAPRIFDIDKNQLSIFYSFPSAFSLFNDLILKRKIFKNLYIYGKREQNDYAYNQKGMIKNKNIRHCSGAAFIISSKLYFSLNGFDERYFLYLEETDLMKRVINKQYKIIYERDISVKHFKDASAGKTFSNYQKNIIIFNSLILYHKLNNSFFSFVICKGIVKVYAFLLYFYSLLSQDDEKLEYSRKLLKIKPTENDMKDV